ncbi:MAG: NUDIX domain-containing protein [Acidimicrobiia bacterium]
MSDGGEPLAWRQLSTKPVYANPWMSLREDQVLMPDGNTTVYGVITTAPAMGILPFLDDDTVVMVQQWRYVAGRTTWEMPTGGAHPGETLIEAAQRELTEEIGYRAGHLEHLSTFNTSKSIMDETAHLFVARDLERAAAVPDATEFIVVREFAFDDVLSMVRRGEIVDAMTIIAVLLAARYR